MKKWFAVGLSLLLLFTLSVGALAETVSLRVWGSQEDQELLGELVENFKAANPDKEFEFTLGVVGEGDARTRYLEDPAAAADVFAFANDHIYDLVNAGAIYEVTRNKDAIVAANMPSSIDAATVDGVLYAYPMTADNGYFLYYDKSVLSEEDVQSLDTILEKCNAAGKKFFMDVSNGWYNVSFFLGAGCTLGRDADGNQTCDFNSDNGVLAGEAIKALTANDAFLTGDDPILQGGMGDTIAAGVSGTWNATTMMEKLGDNYAATKLPTFTLGDQQAQMGSFSGYKLVGVNTMSASPEEAMDFAEFITNEESQKLRFEKRALGPSNLVVADSDEVKADIALSALAAQMEFAVSQKDVLSNFWNPAEAFGTTMEAKDYTKDVKTLLDEMVAQITAPI